MRILCLIIALSVGACAPSYTWEHPGIDEATADRQREIDTAECSVAAMRTVPRPQMPALPPSPTPQSCSVRGTATVYDANGNAYTGDYNGTAGSETSGFDPARSVIEGEEAGELAQESQESNVARRKFAEACMMRRGWVKVMAGQQPNLAVEPALETQARATAALPIQSAAPVATAATPSAAPYQSFDAWQKGRGN